MEKFNYRDLMMRGFDRHESTDSVYMDQHGHYPIILNKEVAPGIQFEWDHETRHLVLSRLKEDGDYLAKMPIRSLLELDELTVFFTQTREEYLERRKATDYPPGYMLLA